MLLILQHVTEDEEAPSLRAGRGQEHERGVAGEGAQLALLLLAGGGGEHGPRAHEDQLVRMWSHSRPSPWIRVGQHQILPCTNFIPP